MKKNFPLGNTAPSIRILDLFLSLVGIITLFPIIIFFAILIILIDKHNPFFIQERIGRRKIKFSIIKLRTMKKSTPNLPAHEISQSYVTPLGKILRKTKIDEIPQVINVLKGDMSIVGPRPCLENETETIRERDKRGIYSYYPGITGLAAINKVDMSKPKLVARLDYKTIRHLNVLTYFSLICKTAMGKGMHDPIENYKLKKQSGKSD